MQQTLSYNSGFKSLLPKQRRKVFKLMVLKGYDSTKIAEVLGVAKRTVINHRTLLYKDLGVKNQFELMATAIQELSNKNARLNKLIDECIYRTPTTPKEIKDFIKSLRQKGQING